MLQKRISQVEHANGEKQTCATPPVSCLVLTKNEEKNLPGCLESLWWCDDIVVFDSHSTDATVEIAKAAGCRVVQRKFDNYGAQREAARGIEYENEWVLAIDADERPDRELIEEVLRIVEMSDSPHSAFRMRRKDHFMGRWLKYCSLYPSWFVRFYKPDSISYSPRTVHEYPDVDGSTGELSGHLIHDNFSKGLEEWLVKHVKYAGLEAQEDLRSLGEPLPLSSIFTRDPVRRRQALKSLSFRMPLRPFLRFAYMYIYRRGFLDGRAGLTYCTLISIYEYMIVLRMKEIRGYGDKPVDGS